MPSDSLILTAWYGNALPDEELGTAIIESIFMWDGVGKLAVDAITMRDYPMIQAYVVWMAIIYVMVNLVTDLLYHLLDPRIRLGVSE